MMTGLGGSRPSGNGTETATSRSVIVTRPPCTKLHVQVHRLGEHSWHRPLRAYEHVPCRATGRVGQRERELYESELAFRFEKQPDERHPRAGRARYYESI